MAFAAESIDLTLKVIVVGNGQVGKTTMLQRFCKGHFTPDYKKTIGTDFMQKKIYLEKFGDQEITLDLWDTAGQEVFAELTAGYYRSAGACALAFSTTDRASFEAIENWKAKVERVCGPLGDRHAPVMALVQTKTDLVDSPEAQIDPQEANALAKKLGIKFFRTSSKAKLNVDELFEYLAEAWMRKQADDGARDAVPAAGSGGVAAPAEKRQGFAEDKKSQPLSLKGEEGGKTEKGKQRAKGKKKKCTIL
eukprot:TRINITY_DN22186_c0_g1_i1.p2 TRINITY_DN22186_c0_g1~~TRINITY_DN22186_c0_g1_i1.p2  ORF type:complete len:250 (+),score=99.77 TRINITY_DN22186_c0_g1_i1:84-833(+)